MWELPTLLSGGCRSEPRTTSWAWRERTTSFSATGSETDTCNFDISSGIAPAIACHTFSSPALLPIVAAWPPGPLGAVPVEACVNVAANVTVAIGATHEPGSGLLQGRPGQCWRNAQPRRRLVQLQDSSPDRGRDLERCERDYDHVNVQSLTISEAGANWNDVFIKTPGSVAQSRD
jgi:hypothetical protein